MKVSKTSFYLLEKLNTLAQAEIDIFFAFETATQNITSTKLRYTLNRLKKDHYQHIQDLCLLIMNLGGIPPQKAPDLKGYFMEDFTRICSSVGLRGALKAIESNENIVTVLYKDLLKVDLPKRIKASIEKNKRDEETHLLILEKLLDSETFEINATNTTAS
jgi:bacterioferritin (cytochrome b1)